MATTPRSGSRATPKPASRKATSASTESRARIREATPRPPHAPPPRPRAAFQHRFQAPRSGACRRRRDRRHRRWRRAGRQGAAPQATPLPAAEHQRAGHRQARHQEDPQAGRPCEQAVRRVHARAAQGRRAGRADRQRSGLTGDRRGRAAVNDAAQPGLRTSLSATRARSCERPHLRGRRGRCPSRHRS